MAKIKVSIVIATRNEERTIGKCIESLLTQNYQKNKYEIIFSDGRSRDRTREIIQSYARKAKNPNIILLDNPNTDSGSGRNIGIKKSRGEFIVQLSG
ncbi:TPA: glycosyltransferase, partial [archaeon]|nr:glycosyltransferase [Candidatus Naiadarchaeum limnaeum]